MSTPRPSTIGNINERRKTMKQNVWLSVSLAMILPVMIFTVSCSKKVVKTQQAATMEPEVQQAPEPSTEVANLVESPNLAAAERAFVGEKIHFAFDSSDLSSDARQILSGQAEYLRTNPDIRVTVEGYCDDRGTESYNMSLGKRRAESVRNFLVDMGISRDRLNTVTYGEQRPIAMGENENAWAQNRRAEFVIN
jgi:peptidoglycan-associated lipoprotein